MNGILHAAYEARWIFVAIAFLVLGALYGEALSELASARYSLRKLRRHNRVLRDEVARLRAQEANERFEVVALDRYRGRRG